MQRLHCCSYMKMYESSFVYVVPAGKTCPPLPLIDDGGVIYTDLLLSVGVVANYVCNEGYSLHGHGRFECLDGLWIDDHAEQIIVKPTCEGEA